MRYFILSFLQIGFSSYSQPTISKQVIDPSDKIEIDPKTAYSFQSYLTTKIRKSINADKAQDLKHKRNKPGIGSSKQKINKPKNGSVVKTCSGWSCWLICRYCC